MAVYFDKAIEKRFDHSPEETCYTDVHWHCEYPIIAVASKNEMKNADGAVTFHLEEVIEILFCFERMLKLHVCSF